MIVAEKDSRCTTINTPGHGGVRWRHTGFYRELQVINNTNVPICIITKDEEHILVDPHTFCQDPHVLVIYRDLVGQRAFSSVDVETTRTPHNTTKIPNAVLNEGPVYLEGRDIVIAHTLFSVNAHHPASEKSLTRMMRNVQKDVLRSVHHSPIGIAVNDPSGKLTSLYVYISGVISTVRVTAAGGTGDDHVTVSWRDASSTDNDDPMCVHDTLTALMARPGDPVWQVGPIVLSVNKTCLKAWIAKHTSAREYNRDTISVDDHERIITEARSQDADTIELLNKQNKHLQERLRVTEKMGTDILDGKLMEDQVAHRSDTMALERAKIAATVREIDERLYKMRVDNEAAQKKQEAAVSKEFWETFGTVAKTAAVVIPAVVAIMKYLDKD
jgi:hypothetical protein